MPLDPPVYSFQDLDNGNQLGRLARVTRASRVYRNYGVESTARSGLVWALTILNVRITSLQWSIVRI